MVTQEVESPLQEPQQVQEYAEPSPKGHMGKKLGSVKTE